MIQQLLNLGLMFFEYFSCVGVKEGFLNYLENVLLFISGLCFGYCFAFFYLKHVVNDDTGNIFSEYLAKKILKINRTAANKYVPTYQEDYKKLPWYQRDMMSYIDHVKYKTMRGDTDQYLVILK